MLSLDKSKDQATLAVNEIIELSSSVLGTIEGAPTPEVLTQELLQFQSAIKSQLANLGAEPEHTVALKQKLESLIQKDTQDLVRQE